MIILSSYITRKNVIHCLTCPLFLESDYQKKNAIQNREDRRLLPERKFLGLVAKTHHESHEGTHGDLWASQSWPTCCPSEFVRRWSCCGGSRPGSPAARRWRGPAPTRTPADSCPSPPAGEHSSEGSALQRKWQKKHYSPKIQSNAWCRSDYLGASFGYSALDKNMLQWSLKNLGANKSAFRWGSRESHWNILWGCLPLLGDKMPRWRKWLQFCP